MNTLIKEKTIQLEEMINQYFYVQKLHGGVYVLFDNILPGGNLNYFLANEIINFYEKQNLINDKTVIVSKEDNDFSLAIANICTAKNYDFYFITDKLSIEDLLNFKLLKTKTILNSRIYELKKDNLKKYFGNKKDILYIDLGECEEIIKNRLKTILPINYQVVYNSNISTIVVNVQLGMISKILVKEFKKLFNGIKIIGVFINNNKTNYELLLRTKEYYDDFYMVNEKDAYDNMIKLIKEYNIYSGIKGASTINVARMNNENNNNNILAIVSDRMERYYSLIQYYQI